LRAHRQRQEKKRAGPIHSISNSVTNSATKVLPSVSISNHSFNSNPAHPVIGILKKRADDKLQISENERISSENGNVEVEKV